MNQSEKINNLAFALARAQAEFPPVKMNATNPFLKNKYADLGAVIETVRPILAKNGLSVLQFPTSQEGRVGVRTVLMHESGEFMEEVVSLVPDNAKGLSVNQSAGVTISYLRRYALAAILNLYTEEDIDGDVHSATNQEMADLNKTVGLQMSARQWSPEQTEAVSRFALDNGLDPMTAEDVAEILNWSAMPADAPVKTIESWFKYFVKSNGASVQLKAADANDAYLKAKKTNGGKSK
jgi:hypothetical protein